MRGTGCSGGAFDLFGPSTTYDGYDAIEIVAHQPWVKGHKVGMVGISFSGISQLFVAGTDPPDLAAIAPLSVTDDLYSTGYPGGIYNSGFAASWVAQREADAQPAPSGGEGYARALIKAGDRQCLVNQRLRLQTPVLSTILGPDSYRTPSLFDPRSPSFWAKKIRVPVFLAGAFQDEQTGGQWPALVPNLASDKNVFVTMLNGAHIDSLGPERSRGGSSSWTCSSGTSCPRRRRASRCSRTSSTGKRRARRASRSRPSASRTPRAPPPRRRPSRRAHHESGCCSTMVVATQGRGLSSPSGRLTSRRGPRRVPFRPASSSAPAARWSAAARPIPPGASRSSRIPPPARPPTSPGAPTCGRRCPPTTGRRFAAPTASVS